MFVIPNFFLFLTASRVKIWISWNSITVVELMLHLGAAVVLLLVMGFCCYWSRLKTAGASGAAAGATHDFVLQHWQLEHRSLVFMEQWLCWMFLLLVLQPGASAGLAVPLLELPLTVIFVYWLNQIVDGDCLVVTVAWFVVDQHFNGCISTWRGVWFQLEITSLLIIYCCFFKTVPGWIKSMLLML